MRAEHSFVIEVLEDVPDFNTDFDPPGAEEEEEVEARFFEFDVNTLRAIW